MESVSHALEVKAHKTLSEFGNLDHDIQLY